MNLTFEEAELYYKLHWAVLAYTNCRREIVPGATTPDEMSHLSTPEKMKVREVFYGGPDLLENFVIENPEGFSPDELAVVASWRHRISGEFYIVRYLKKYTVFLGSKPERLYGILGLYDPIEDIFGGRPLPIYVKTVLLPFRDKIIYDGLMSSYNVYFGGGIRSGVKETYNRLKAREGIIERLVEPDGRPMLQTSLARQAPRKPAPDWKPLVDEVVLQVEKMRQTDTPTQDAAVGLLRAAARLTQATLHQPDAMEDHVRQLSSVRRALTRLEKVLCEDDYKG